MCVLIYRVITVLQLKRYKYFSAGLLMETDPWVKISKEHPKRRHPNRRALMAARRARILKMKRKMKEDQEWQPNKVASHPEWWTLFPWLLVP